MKSSLILSPGGTILSDFEAGDTKAESPVPSYKKKLWRHLSSDLNKLGCLSLSKNPPQPNVVLYDNDFRINY